MATAIAMMIGGAIVNGLAFTGSSYLFHSLDKPNSDKERKRHDLAIEQLNRDTELWNEERKKKLDFINEELNKRNIAARDLQHMDDAMNLYYAFSKQKITLPPKPTLSQYYQPSEEMRKYEYLWIILGTTGIGFLAYKYF
ncbi:hypothetical protein [Sulfurimonas sp.]|uniref:hypothetical protein n=1 Tax=Sulfurimonas sp. TaxID=2022749 RepID=UPI003D10A5B0